eukprot:Tamp_17219.p1 GENE.Tamp_17219~~Tamp_17219.p1  ORF type:complete len:220 (+),score=45.49 Tamp_17219:241-900(+)
MGGAFSTKKAPAAVKEAKEPVKASSTKASRRLTTVGPSIAEKVKSGETISSGTNEYLRYHAHSSAGYEPDNVRKTNQDSFIAIDEFQGDTAISLFGVFDGHGASGHLVSQYVAEELPKLLNRDVLRRESDVPSDKAEGVAKILLQAFEKVNNMLETNKTIDSSLSGVYYCLFTTVFYYCLSTTVLKTCLRPTRPSTLPFLVRRRLGEWCWDPKKTGAKW